MTDIKEIVKKGIEYVRGVSENDGYHNLIYQISKYLVENKTGTVTQLMNDSDFIKVVGGIGYEMIDIYFAIGLMDKYGYLAWSLSDLTNFFPTELSVSLISKKGDE